MKNYISLILLITSFCLKAQVKLSIEALSQNPIQKASYKTSAIGDTIDLPIIDEFSQKGSIPNQKYWNDDKVIINNSYGQFPLSIGFATFDGLDRYGFPYDDTDNSSDTIADVLTSKFIKLQGKNNVFLSFYHQAGGYGERPSTSDSLTVQFWDATDSTWEHVWGVKGSADTLFRAAMIPVDSLKWLTDNFQFRVAAYGARNGAFDIWNLDYLHLGANRNLADSVANDPAFSEPLPSFHKRFQSVPWFHFQSNQLKDTLKSVYRRNGPTPSPPWSLTKNKWVLFENGAVVQTNPGVINSADPHNVNLTNPMSIGSFAPTVPTDSFNLGFAGILPGTNVQPFNENDTLFGFQTFQNYYAKDDGSAERGIGVANVFGGRLAFRFVPEQPDSLKGLYLRFAHSGVDARDYTFKIGIWEDDGGIPGKLIYLSDSSYSPDYGYYHDSYMPYALDTPAVHINGNVFIGIRQNTDQPLHLGFDVNSEFDSELFYGDSFFWYEVFVKGNAMIRPYFREQVQNIGITENKHTWTPKIYPNPAKELLNISNANGAQVKLINLLGEVVFSQNIEETIDVRNIDRGIYIISISKENDTHIEKIILN